MKHSAHYKDFESYEEMVAYCKEWPDLPIEIEYFEKFFAQQLEALKINLHLNPGFTFRTAFRLLRISTDWCEPQKPGIYNEKN